MVMTKRLWLQGQRDGIIRKDKTFEDFEKAAYKISKNIYNMARRFEKKGITISIKVGNEDEVKL